MIELARMPEVDALLRDLDKTVRRWQRRMGAGAAPLRVGEAARLQANIKAFETVFDLFRNDAQMAAYIDSQLVNVYAAGEEQLGKLTRDARAAQAFWYEEVGWKPVLNKRVIKDVAVRSQQAITKDFSRLPQTARTKISDAVRGVILNGDNPEQAARQLSKRLGSAVKDARNRASVILRTESQDNYVNASTELYAEHSDMLAGWEWQTAATDVCPICTALDGRLFPAGAVMNSHVNCRCDQVPVLNDDPKYRGVNVGDWPPNKNLSAQIRADRDRIGLRANGDWRDSWALDTKNKRMRRPVFAPK